jgi:hypothetical protein
MGELSFLTIVVSLAVCSLLVYAAFQYMKVRLSVLEQSHKEQAMILQQYIEESSTDIHRLYQMTTMPTSGRDSHGLPFPVHGSIILDYANDNNEQNEKEKPAAYNQTHTIHLDTAFFQNKRASNLIEISSNSEDTTDSESETESESETMTTDTEEETSDTDTDTDTDNYDNVNTEEQQSEGTTVVTDNAHGVLNKEHAVVSEIVEIICDEVVHTSEIKTVTLDLGPIQETDVIKSSVDNPVDVLSMLYKKAQQTPLPDDDIIDDSNYATVVGIDSSTVIVNNDDTQTLPLSPAPEPAPAAAPAAAPTNVPLSAMSVPDLKLLLKEKFKNQPEKHAEIQKLKKAELIYTLQQL